MFDGCGPEVRLDHTDCGLVTSTHSSQLAGLPGAGTRFKSGHCDFWMNGGLQQPLCGPNPSLEMFLGLAAPSKGTAESGAYVSVLGCNHLRAMEYYLSEVRGVCAFRGVRARCGNGEECSALGEGDDAAGGGVVGAPMPLSPDDRCKPGMFRDYDFKTTGTPPYC